MGDDSKRDGKKSPPADRGCFILLEGLDRSGKSTQCRLLHEYLNNLERNSAELWRFPDRETPIGKMIDGYLRSQLNVDDRAIHMLFGANRWEKFEQMKKALAAGRNIVVDRYSYSGVAFSAAKGLDFDWCFEPEIGLVQPDVVIFLDISQSDAEARGGFGSERYEKKEFQAVVASMFRRLQSSNWKVLNANTTIEKLHVKIAEIATESIKSCKNQPLKYFTRSSFGQESVAKKPSS